MASTFSARFRPVADPATASIYETIREHDEEIEDDVDEHLDNDAFSASARPHINHRSTVVIQRPSSRKPRQAQKGRSRRHPISSAGAGVVELDDVEDDVPASLLIEDNGRVQGQANLKPIGHESPIRPSWDSPSPVRFRDENASLPMHNVPRTTIGTSTMATASRKEKALWRWANVENLDNFLFDVYDYYTLRGYWSIVLRRCLNMFTLAFLLGFCLFLTQCVNYRKIKGSTKLEEILVPRCTARMGFVPNFVLWLTAFVCIVRSFQYALDLRRLNHLHDFYHHLLSIPEAEIQSISWQEVVSRLMALRDSNPNIKTANNSRAKTFLGTQSKQRMDAHDIANRLMRRDNYMIAMINKEIIDTTLTLPFIGTRQFFTRTLEWHLNYCIMDYIFSQQGQPRQLFLKDTHRRALSEGLKRRFIFAGTTSLIFAPFLIVYNIIQNFFQHFNEYQKDPSQISTRQYNLYAQWKFREFNELWHLFDRRLKMSHPFATRYVNQFPKDKTVQAARFITFVSGAIIAVLGLATVLDQESFLAFEITPGRTTIFYLGVFGSIWAVARGMLPDENMIYDSSYSMEEVIEFTHYKPSHWDGRLHTVEVKSEFEQLYQMRIVILLEEILSMIFTPFVLWFTLPKCSDRIIDFFREFTVNVDGLGYVCSFAEFNFKKSAQTGTGDNAGTRATRPSEIAMQAREQEYYATKDDKLEQSYYNFLNDYSRNPKADIRFSYAGRHRTRQFHAPPPFPGPLSPVALEHNLDHASSSQRPIPPGNHRTSLQRGHTTSPPQSLLLDPHHQPLGRSVLGSPQAHRSRKIDTTSRVLPTASENMMSTVLKEEDEEANALPNDVLKQASTSNTSQSAGGLGSWKFDNELEEDATSEEDPTEIVHGGGVLGLIKQFQKAHEDDKRGNTGV